MTTSDAESDVKLNFFVFLLLELYQHLGELCEGRGGGRTVEIVRVMISEGVMQVGAQSPGGVAIILEIHAKLPKRALIIDIDSSPIILSKVLKFTC